MYIIYTYIYICIEREREMHIQVYVYTVYIHVVTYDVFSQGSSSPEEYYLSHLPVFHASSMIPFCQAPVGLGTCSMFGKGFAKPPPPPFRIPPSPPPHSYGSGF